MTKAIDVLTELDYIALSKDEDEFKKKVFYLAFKEKEKEYNEDLENFSNFLDLYKNVVGFLVKKYG